MEVMGQELIIPQPQQLRDSRKDDVERHIAQLKELSRKAAAQANGDSSSDEDWDGIDSNTDDEEVGEGDVATKLNMQEEYIDEDKFTTVTVETMDFNAEEEIDSETERANAAKRKAAEQKEKEKKKKKPKEKKKKFRYLTKTERKSDRVKQRTKLAKRREKHRDADAK